MKKLLKFALLAVLLSALCGCASSGEKYETRLTPPDAFSTHWLDYQKLPGQKVMTIAVDPTGQWAFGFDYDRETIEEAAQNAALKCDKAREKHQVFTRAKLFAVNDEIVYNNDRFQEK